MMTNPRVIIGNNTNPPGDDRLRVRGRFQVENRVPVINPVQNGIRFTIYSRFNGTELLSFVVPPGARASRNAPGWFASSTGTRWTYEDRGGTRTPGLERVTVVHKSAVSVGLYDVSVYGRKGSFHIEPFELPLRLDIVLGGAPQAAAGQCGVGLFNIGSSRAPKCNVSGVFANTINCR
jgi:hypothetical protein